MHFGVVVPIKVNKLKTHVFGNLVLFLHIECYSYVLTFWYLRSSKTLIIHFSRNLFSFSHIVYFACILAFFVRNELRNLKIQVFWGKLLCFLFMRFSGLVCMQLKNAQNTRFWLCFVFPFRVLSMLFSVLVPNTHKKKTFKRHVSDNVSFPHIRGFCILYSFLVPNTHSKYTFSSFSPYRELFLSNSVLVTKKLFFNNVILFFP